jgi:hypothetical protein
MVQANSRGYADEAELSPVERELDARLADAEAGAPCGTAYENAVRLESTRFAEAVVADAAPLSVAPRNVRTQSPPTDSTERKRTPLCTGLLDYAPSALDLIAHASEDEFPDADADGLDLEDQIFDALRHRDTGGAPSWPDYRRLCLAALAILHRELTGDPPPRPERSGMAALFAACPQALAEVAQVSWYGNEKHNPGQPLHHARAKSTDHADCILRHTVDNMSDPGGYDGDMRHAACLVWRCLILTQVTLEASGARKARGAR